MKLLATSASLVLLATAAPAFAFGGPGHGSPSAAPVFHGQDYLRLAFFGFSHGWNDGHHDGWSRGHHWGWFKPHNPHWPHDDQPCSP